MLFLLKNTYAILIHPDRTLTKQLSSREDRHDLSFVSHHLQEYTAV